MSNKETFALDPLFTTLVCSMLAKVNELYDEWTRHAHQDKKRASAQACMNMELLTEQLSKIGTLERTEHGYELKIQGTFYHATLTHTTASVVH